jgi:hypothetical protein
MGSMMSLRNSSRIDPDRNRDLSIDYLRTTLTLMVLAHHSALAYVTFATFDKVDILRSSAPVVDQARWRFLDYAENFNDVFFMSLMFFISGLFVHRSLTQRGTLGFVKDRLLRLGAPFAATVLCLIPIAYFASWRLAGRSAGFIVFYRQFAASGFAAGPAWFIWLLLAFDIVLAALLACLPNLARATANRIQKLEYHPLVAYFGLVAAVLIVYLPLLWWSEGAWSYVLVPAFAFQVSRLGVYALWFLSGYFLGRPGLGQGLLSRNGGLVRYWPLWMCACVLAYNALWFLPKLSAMSELPPLRRGALEAGLWTVSCAASSFGFLAMFRGVQFVDRPWMRSLSRSAYTMYLVHYVFVVWTQYLLLTVGLDAEIKFAIVFVTTVLLSWLSAQIALRIPIVKTIL